MIRLVLPWPPSVNGYWRSYRGRQIISKRGREYRASAAAEMAVAGLLNAQISGPVKVSIDLHPPTLRRYDVDNWAKAPLDALTHAGVWQDDEQVQELTLRKCGKEKPGCIVIEIEEIAKG